MASNKGAKTPTKLHLWSFADREFPFPIIVCSLLILSLSYCAKGGGTPASTVQEAGVFDSSTAPVTATETSTEAEAPHCGNGIVETDKGEVCDLTDLGGASCASLSEGRQEGELSCNQDCTYNDIMCYDMPVSGSGGDTATAGSYGGP